MLILCFYPVKSDKCIPMFRRTHFVESAVTDQSAGRKIMMTHLRRKVGSQISTDDVLQHSADCRKIAVRPSTAEQQL